MEADLRRAKQYSKRKTQLLIIRLLLTAGFLIIVLFSDMSLILRDIAANWSRNFYVQVGFYLIILAGVDYLLFAGIDFYSGFFVEHKFQLSNQTVLGWLIRHIKEGLLGLTMLLIAGEILYFFLRHFPNIWWLPVTAAWLLFTIGLGKITPVLIIPLFYKCVPLAGSQLKERLLKLGENCGVKIERVFEIRLSKDTEKANAAVAGLGKGRRILLGDTLLKKYSAEEIEAIFAHELGHVRLSHTLKTIGFGTASALVCFYLTSLLFKTGTGLCGFNHIYDIAAFPLLAIIAMIVGLVLTPIQNAYMRHLEKQADMFALGHVQDKQSFVCAIRKLGEQNLSDPSPNRLEELFLYTHPPISERLRYAGEKK
jgi:STE24 endopeptidase